MDRTAISHRLGDEVLAHAGDGVRHLAAGLRRHRFARTLVTRARRAAQRLRGKGIHPLGLEIYEERRRCVDGALSTAIADRISRASIVHWH